MPITKIKNGFFEKIATQATPPPKAKEPVSPINIFAGYAFCHKKANNPPNVQEEKRIKDSVFCEGLLKFNKIKIIKNVEKYAIAVFVASPSNPSVKFTEFVVAINTTNVKGIYHHFKSRYISKNGTNTDDPIA